MARRTYAILPLVFLLGAALLVACGERTGGADNAPQDTAPTISDGANQAEPSSPQARPLPDAPPGTASVKDARIANDVLLAMVSDRDVDAQDYSVYVVDGVVTLKPAEDLDDETKQRAKELVLGIDGVEDARFEGEKPTSAIDRNGQNIAGEVEQAARNQAANPTGAGDSTDQDEGSAGADDTAQHASDEGQAALQAGADDAAIQKVVDVAKPAAPGSDEKAFDAQDKEEAQEEDATDEKHGEVETRKYIIKAGDSLSIIASRELGSGARWSEVYKLNRDIIGPNPDGIHEGMVIRLPVK